MKQIFPFKVLASHEVKANFSTAKFYIENYEYFMLEYVVEGAGYVECNGEKYHCTKDSIYFFQPGGNYFYYHDPECPWRKILTIFTGNPADALVDAYNLRGKVFFPNQSQCLPFLKELINLGYNNNESACVTIHHILHQLQKCEFAADHIPPQIYSFKIQLEESLHKKFVLNDYAEEHDISSAYLIAKFKEYYHCTPYEYLIKCRMNSACSMLKYTHLSIKEIASILNFNDQYYFSNLFKQRFGISPNEFRKKHSK